MDPGNIAWVILSAAKEGQWGKHKLAAFLKGSKEKKIFNSYGSSGYGGLFWLAIYEIEGYILQLEQLGLLKRANVLGSIYSFYEVTESGEKAISEKMPIQFQAVAKKKNISSLILSESEKRTLELFNNGKSISEIAAERSLAVSTIYSHFEKLILNRLVSADAIITEEKIKLISSQITLPCKSLKEIKERLPESVSYGEIRCIVAQLSANEKD